MKDNNFELPEQIEVKILKHDSGEAYFAELPEFGVFTEANTLEDLYEMVNDLIYELFDIPQNVQSQIKYASMKTKTLSEKVDSLSMMMTPELYRNQYYVV